MKGGYFLVKKREHGTFQNSLYCQQEEPLGFDCKFAHGVEKIFPLLLLGAQTLLMLVEPTAQRSGLLGSQIQRFVLLAL